MASGLTKLTLAYPQSARRLGKPAGRGRPGPAGVGLYARGDWRRRAACAGSDPELFFPVGDGEAARNHAARAKRICASGPVRKQCRLFAMQTNQLYGIWGGLDEIERRDSRPQPQHLSAARGRSRYPARRP